MAVLGLGFETQQGRGPLGGDLGRLRELELRLGFLQVRLEDLMHLLDAAGAGRLAAGLGRAQRPQVQIVDPRRLQAARQQGLGEAGASRGGHGADVQHDLHAGPLQPADDVIQGRALVADRGEHPHQNRGGRKVGPWNGRAGLILRMRAFSAASSPLRRPVMVISSVSMRASRAAS